MSTLFRLMTANLLKDRTDPVLLEGLLDRIDPDLVMFQEMGAKAAEVLAARYDHRFLLPSIELEGRGVATRFQAECESLSLPWRPGVLAKLALDSKTLVVAGVHMSNPIDFPWWRSVRQRSDQVTALISWADGESADAIVVAGDMNASPLWPLYRRLTDPWEDLVLAASSRSGTTPEPTCLINCSKPRTSMNAQ